jgi:phosphonate transport system permease protein
VTLVTTRRSAAPLFGAALLVYCWQMAGIRPSVLWDREAVAAAGSFAAGLFPPDVSLGFLGVAGAAIVRTLGMAVTGTVLSIALALPMAVLATRTLWQRGVLLAGEPPGLAGFARGVVAGSARAVLRFLRAVPDLVWALLFVVAVGLGPVAGVLALAIGSAGVLGRVYADVFEAVDPGPLEALHATGATRLQVFLVGIWPQAARSVLAYTLYSFECGVRAASVLGFVGAGGIGYEIQVSMRLFRYHEVLTLIASFVLLATSTEALGRWIRRRLDSNRDARGAARVLGAGPARGAQLIAGAAVLCASAAASGFFDVTRCRGLLDRMGRFAMQLVPFALDSGFLRSLARPLEETIAISIVGTAAGVVLGGALAIPATSTLMLPRDDAAGRHPLLERAAGWACYRASRLTLGVLRSIPDLVWVMVCVLAVGFGPFAGTIALGLHTGGVLGKLYAEVLEEAPDPPIEALRATGAGPLGCLVWGMLPQARAMLVSYTALRWETNLRASTVVGLVGGGGIGLAIYNNIQLGFYPRVATLVVVVYLLVIASDWIADRGARRAELEQARAPAAAGAQVADEIAPAHRRVPS